MKTLAKISCIILALFGSLVLLFVGLAIFSPTDDPGKDARISCMAETQMRFGNDIAYGNMPSDAIALDSGDDRFTVQLRFNTHGGPMVTAVCDVKKKGDKYGVASLNIIR